MNKNRVMTTKLYYLILWMACLMVASCDNKDFIEQPTKPVHSNTLNVVIENKESRSVLNYEGTFFWTENDFIGVYGSDTENACFHLTSQADGVSTFSGNMNTSGEQVSWAYFPYSKEVDIVGNKLSFPMSANRTISNENHSPMMGRVEAGNMVRFYHAGGILYLKIVGLPESAAQLVVTSEGENSPYLAGTAIVDDITADDCCYHIEDGSREVIYNVKNVNKDEYFHYIYVPLQVGNYEKIRVALKNEAGNIIGERSLSNLIVNRAKMTETPVLNFSEKIYGYQLSEEWLAETEWDEAMLFSNEWLIACNNEDEEGRTYFISNVMDWGSQDARALQVMMDADGNVLNMTSGSFAAYFSNRNGDNVDITLMLEDNIETITNRYIPSRKAHSRAGVESYIVSDILPLFDLYGSVKKMLKPEWKDFERIERELGLTEVGLQAISMSIENKALKIVVGIAGETFSGACEGAVAGLIIGSCLGPEAIVPGVVGGALTGAGTGAIEGILKIIAEELDAYNNRRIYQRYCGNAQIVLGEPKQISDNMFSVEYSLSNTQSVPVVYKNRGRCGLLVKEFSNYNIAQHALNRIRYGGIGVRSYGEKDLSADWTHVEKITFRKGYTYLMVAYVTAFDVTDENVVNTLHPICYYSDVKKISFYDSSISNVTITPNNPMAYYNDNFTTTVKADVQCDAKNWKVSILCGGQSFAEQSFSGNHSQTVVFNLSISRFYFDLKTMSTIKPDDRWQISVTAMDNQGNSSSTYKDLNFVYDVSSSIEIISAKEIETKEVSSSSRAADDDEEEEGVNVYQTTYEITVQVKGAPRFRYYQLSASEGRLFSGNIVPGKDGTYVYKGTLVYKEGKAPEYIYINGYVFYYSGGFERFNATVMCIGDPISSCKIL